MVIFPVQHSPTSLNPGFLEEVRDDDVNEILSFDVSTGNFSFRFRMF